MALKLNVIKRVQVRLVENYNLNTTLFKLKFNEGGEKTGQVEKNVVLTINYILKCKSHMQINKKKY